jgi:predicted amino acid dehydrogenase
LSELLSITSCGNICITPQGTVLITGASSGIGAELSYIFAEHGHDLVLVRRNKEQLECVKNNVESKYGKTARTIALDLSVPGKPKQLYYQVTLKNVTLETGGKSPLIIFDDAAGNSRMQTENNSQKGVVIGSRSWAELYSEALKPELLIFSNLFSFLFSLTL